MGKSRSPHKDSIIKNGKNTKNFNESKRIISWFPVTRKQRDEFIQISIRGGWIGIGLLVVLWIIVRIVGPSLGWWVPADIH